MSISRPKKLKVVELTQHKGMFRSCFRMGTKTGKWRSHRPREQRWGGEACVSNLFNRLFY